MPELASGKILADAIHPLTPLSHDSRASLNDFAWYFKPLTLLLSNTNSTQTSTTSFVLEIDQRMEKILMSPAGHAVRTVEWV